MTTPGPGWHPDPEGNQQLRYWDGQQWTSATQPVPTPQTPMPETPAQAKDRKRQLIAIAIIIAAVASIAIFKSIDFSSDDTETAAAETTTTKAATTTTSPTTTTATRAAAPIVPLSTTVARPSTTTASMPAGCRDTPTEYLDIINASFLDGYSFGETKAIQKGEFWYIGGQIHNAEGGIRSRDDLFVAKDMIVTPVTTTARNQSTLPDLRKVLNVSFSDPAATAALDCARTY